MSNSGLSYGLNFTKKPPSRLLNNNNGRPTNSSGNQAQSPPLANLSSQLSAKKQSAAAEEIDASIYDYDGYHDAIASSRSKPSSTSAVQGPKYMARLLEAAETRKRDQLRAKEKMLAKEREAEGDAFADKEKFVTGAYRAQQAEVARLEEEERQREMQEAEKRRRMGGGAAAGMRGLYKGLLDREERRFEDSIKAIEEQAAAKEQGRGKGDAEIDWDEENGEDKEMEKQARKAGADVNEDGQVVDKRELLKAGLNIKAKPARTGNSNNKGSGIERSESMALLSGSGGRNASKQAMRERQSRMLEAQLEGAAKRAAEDELEEQRAVQRAAKSRKTEGDISSAKERYLQRKREAEAAKAAEAAENGTGEA